MGESYPYGAVVSPASTWQTLLDVDFTAQATHDFTSASNAYGGATFSLSNAGTVDTAEVDAGALGLHINVNGTQATHVPASVGSVGFPLSDLPAVTQDKALCIQAVVSIPGFTSGGASYWIGGIQIRDGSDALGLFEEADNAATHQYGRIFRYQGSAGYSAVRTDNTEWTFLEILLPAGWDSARCVYGTYGSALPTPGSTAFVGTAGEEYMGLSKRPADTTVLAAATSRIEFFAQRGASGVDLSIYLQRIAVRVRAATA